MKASFEEFRQKLLLMERKLVLLSSLDDIFRPGKGFGVFFQVVEHMEDLADVLEHPVFVYYDRD